MTYIVQLFTGAAGSVAFGILFHMKKKHLPLAALGGFLGWLLFIICRGFWGGVFFPTLAAAFGIDLYAEILARSCRSTSTSFFVTSVIPLIPGSTLYYCMRSVVEGNLHQAWNYGRDTFLYALAMEKACKAEEVPGRLIPVPRVISAGCGLAWAAPLEAVEQIKHVMQEKGIEREELHECMV